MFQFGGFTTSTRLQRDRLPHSDICGSMVVCTSPQLFAAYHVLRRLREPRHPPYALIRFRLFDVFDFSISPLLFLSSSSSLRFLSTPFNAFPSTTSVLPVLSMNFYCSSLRFYPKPLASATQQGIEPLTFIR